jgi:hypothetical protein
VGGLADRRNPAIAYEAPPRADHRRDGYLRVDYDKIGVKFQT